MQASHSKLRQIARRIIKLQRMQVFEPPHKPSERDQIAFFRSLICADRPPNYRTPAPPGRLSRASYIHTYPIHTYIFGGMYACILDSIYALKATY